MIPRRCLTNPAHSLTVSLLMYQPLNPLDTVIICPTNATGPYCLLVPFLTSGTTLLLLEARNKNEMMHKNMIILKGDHLYILKHAHMYTFEL